MAIAACRAGALGCLDLEYTVDAVAASAAVERLRRFASGEFAVKLGPMSGVLIDALFSTSLPPWIILAGEDHRLGNGLDERLFRTNRKQC